MVVGLLTGAIESKVRPAVVIASEIYLRERPDACRTGQPPVSAPSPASEHLY